MTTFAQPVEDYLRLRHALGHKLHDHAGCGGASQLVLTRSRRVRHDRVSARVALEPEVPEGSAVPWMRVLVVRGYARYVSGVDRRTEVPPTRADPIGQRRRAPFIYGNARSRR
ncbi:MAG: hypothetical protein JO168_19015 [Solirubrobacterales bacterium]|nr:hypothetical protein [Solirubrobacterales bacterium]